MLTLLLLLAPAHAVPLDLCANRGSGSLAGLGGQFLWEVDGNPDLLQPLWWSQLCGVGGNAAPVPTLLAPTEGTVVNPGPVAELAVAADAGDPEHGWGRCEWWAERDGEKYPLAVRLPGGTTSRTSLPFSRTNPVCSGVASRAGLSPGSYLLVVKASDLYGNYGEDAAEVRVNRLPDLLLVEPAESSVYLTGETFTATVLVGDDTPAGAGSVVTFSVAGADGWSNTPCVIETAGSCTATLAAPGVAGAFEVHAAYTDVDAATGEVAIPHFYANDLPGVVITSPGDGEMIDANASTDIVVQVTDATASWGEDVEVTVTDAATSWTSTCTLDGALSCAVPFGPVANGEYVLGASYQDRYGEIGVSPEVAILANDTPTIGVGGVTDGLVMAPGVLSGLLVRVTDDDPAAGALFVSVTDGTSTSVISLGAPDSSGAATASVELPAIAAYSIVLTFVDAYGAIASTDPIAVTTNFAPTLTLASPASGERVTLPANDPAYEVYHYTFLAWDADDSALTVQPAEGLDAFVACTCDATGLGAWECDLDVSSWDTGVHAITVVAADDVEEARESFEIELTSDTSYDYDGDGVLESEWLTYGAGYGDCLPEDPTAYGASPEAGIAAAPELCDTVDNNCDGVVNDGLPDADDDDIGSAQPIAGSVQVLGSGDSVSDVGSLGAPGDVDWWYFEVGEDREGLRNVSFTVSLVVPSADDTTPAGVWELAAAVTTPTQAVPTARGVTAQGTDCASVPGECTLTWEVSGQDWLESEHYWRVSVSAAEWDPLMCAEEGSGPTYAVTVSN